MKKLILLTFLFWSFLLSAQNSSNTSVNSDNVDDQVIRNDPTQVTTLPEFPGGLEKIRRHVSNSFDFTRINGTGKKSAIVTFVIDLDGKMTDLKYTGHKSLGKEMIRVLAGIKTIRKPATFE